MVVRACAVAWVVLLGACVRSNAVDCGDGTLCPADTTCDLEHDLCIVEGQRDACDGKNTDEVCTFSETTGLCFDGLCLVPTCGDERIEPGEMCDDGNLDSGDGCRNDCASDETCGNGVIDHELGEDCDCGKTAVAFGCASVNSMTSTVSTCRTDCKYRCGDNEVQPGERCDGAPPAGESCLDYGYDLGLPGCSPICTPALDTCERIGWLSSDVGIANPRLHAVWGASSTDVFAVAESGGVVRWTGTGWTKMTVPNGTSSLYGIWGRSATDVFAVGNGGTILHYDGATWSPMSSGTTEVLFAVHGDGTRVIAVGGSINGSKILQLTGTGTTWTNVSVAGGFTLRAVVVYAGQAAAVGSDGTVCHAPVSSPWTCSNNNSLGNLAAVAALGTTVYAGGITGLFQPASPGAPSTANFSLVGARAFGDVRSLTVIGGRLIIGGDRVYRLDPKDTNDPDSVDSWYQISEGAVPNAGVWGSALDDIWAVGLGARHFTGTTWSAAPTNTGVHLERVTASAHGAFAVGGQTLLAFIGGAWTPVASANGLNTIVSVSAGTNAVVALEGDGSVFVSPDAPYRNFFEVFRGPSLVSVDLWVRDLSNAFALSFGNQVFTASITTANNTGTPINWQSTTPDLSTAVNGGDIRTIWGFAANNVFVAGDNGQILHWNNVTWTQMTTPVVGIRLRKIWGATPNDVWAVGELGTILHYNGTAWTKQESGTLSTLESVWGTGPNDVYATGGDTLIHYDGTRWVPMRDTTDDYVNDVSGYGDYVHFVGRNGGSELLIRY